MGLVYLAACSFAAFVVIASASEHVLSEGAVSPNEVPADGGEPSGIALSDDQISTSFDAEKKIVAYKNSEERACYIEKIQDLNPETVNINTLFTSQLQVSQKRAQQIWGPRIVEFCDGMQIKLLHSKPPSPNSLKRKHPLEDDLQNAEDETHHLTRKLRSLTSSAEILTLNTDSVDHIALHRETKSNRNKRRTKRETDRKSRYRGQVQTQFIAFGGGNDGTNSGTAEAIAQPEMSRATVSGSQGMGQAQSQSASGDDCDFCIPPTGGKDERLKPDSGTNGAAKSSDTDTRTSLGSGRKPEITDRGHVDETGQSGTQGGASGTTTIPGGQVGIPGFIPGSQGGQFGPGGYPSGQIGVPGQIPSSWQPSIQASTPGQPGAPLGGGSTVQLPSYPGVHVGVPGEDNRGRYPGQSVYPEGRTGVPGSTIYPGAPAESPGQVLYPGIQEGSNVQMGYPRSQVGAPGQSPFLETPRGPGVVPGQQGIPNVQIPPGYPGSQPVAPGRTIYPGDQAGVPGQSIYPDNQAGIPGRGVHPGVQVGGPGQALYPGGQLPPGATVYPGSQTGTSRTGGYPVLQGGAPGYSGGQLGTPSQPIPADRQGGAAGPTIYSQSSTQGRVSGQGGYEGQVGQGQIPLVGGSGQSGYPTGQTSIPSQPVFTGTQGGQATFPGGVIGIPGQTIYPSSQGGISSPDRYPSTSVTPGQTTYPGSLERVPGQLGYPNGQGRVPWQAGYPGVQVGVPGGPPRTQTGIDGQILPHGGQGGTIDRSEHPNGQAGSPGWTSFSPTPSGGQIGFPGSSSGQGYPAAQVGIINQFSPSQETTFNLGGGTGVPSRFPQQIGPGQGPYSEGQPAYVPGQTRPLGPAVPGQTFISPGKIGQSPQQTGTTLGQAFTPGQSGYTPGHVGFAPEQSGYIPGYPGSVPGISGYIPGQVGLPGLTSYIPGQGVQTGLSGLIPGHAGSSPGQPGFRMDHAGGTGGLTIPSGQPGYPSYLPGQTGYISPPGGSVSPIPGQTTQLPGQFIPTPGQTSTLPGQTGFIPGQSGPIIPGSTPSGQAPYLPGQAPSIPSQMGYSPGQTTYAPSQGGLAGPASNIPGQTGTVPGFQGYIPGQTNYIPGQAVPGVSGQYPPTPRQPGFGSTGPPQGLVPNLSGQSETNSGQHGYTPGQTIYIPGQGGLPRPTSAIPGKTPGQSGYLPGQAPFLPGQAIPTGPAGNIPGQGQVSNQGGISGAQGGSTEVNTGQTTYLPGGPSTQGGAVTGFIPGQPGLVPGQVGIPGISGVGTVPGIHGGPEAGGLPGTDVTIPSVLSNGTILYPNGTIVEGPGITLGADGKVDSRFENVTGDAQAETSVFVEGNNTKALASSQGKVGSEVAQAQVSGSYAGTGAFSAQAQTGDDLKRANSQITGGANGTTSLAQGTAGKGQTQSQVSVNGETGATLAETQSTGFNYGTNTQVQAGVRGGMADAQARGQGSTSSQAQIGFAPYQNNSQNNPQTVPFRGGGAASSQTNKHSGQSQTQIQGAFRFGISYTGAAQAGTGSSVNNLKPIPFNASYVVPVVPPTAVPQDLLGLPSDSNALESSPDEIQTVVKPNITDIESNHVGSVESTTQLPQSPSKPQIPKPTLPTSGMLSKSTKNKPFVTSEKKPVVKEIDDDYSDEKEDIYDEELEDVENDLNEETDFRLLKGATKTEAFAAKNASHVSPQLHTTNASQTQSQNVLLTLNGNQNTHIYRASDNGIAENNLPKNNKNFPGTYSGAQGSNSRIASAAGTKTLATASPGSQAQSQTVVISQGAGNVTVVDKNGVKNVYNRSSYVQPRYFSRYSAVGKDDQNPSDLRGDTFVTVTKSETGQLKGKSADNDAANKYAHTYYTKSSTCGYFTFTCSVINGSNGRTKICKPNHVINNDGAPCK